MKLSNIRILYKILGCLGLLALVAGGAMWFATSRMKAIDAEYSAIVADDTAAVIAILRADARVQNFSRLSWKIIAQTKADDLQKTAEESAANAKEVEPLLQEAARKAPRFAEQIGQIGRSFGEILTTDYRLVENFALLNDDQQASRALVAMSPKTTALREQVKSIGDAIVDRMHARAREASEETRSTSRSSLLTIGLALLAVMALACSLVQFGVARPISGLAAALKVMASGDFDVVLPGLGRKDEVGQIAEGVGLVKAMAVEKARKEADDAMRRRQAEAEAEAMEAGKRAEAAREQAQVVHHLGEGCAASRMETSRCA